MLRWQNALSVVWVLDCNLDCSNMREKIPNHGDILFVISPTATASRYMKQAATQAHRLHNSRLSRILILQKNDGTDGTKYSI